MPATATTRPEPTELTKRLVWTAAAGRCTLCNELVTENIRMGTPVPIGELAHNVGWSEDSPRGESELDDEARRAPENLLLVCRNCHKPVDAGGMIGLYSVEELRRRKHDHEGRIRFLTSIGADQQATILRVVGLIRGSAPELSYPTVLAAATTARLYPQQLAGTNSAEYDVDLRSIAGEGTPAYFSVCALQIDARIAQINDGIRRGDIRRLAVFAFARIPLLVHLGAQLDDKIETILFQRHRVDDGNPWCWPADPPAPPSFATTCLQRGTDPQAIALIVNLTAPIQIDQLPKAVRASHTVYVLEPTAPASPHPSLIASRAALAAFEQAARAFLCQIEADHGKPARIALFPSIPLAAAITLGRVLMPQLSPAWTVYDRDAAGAFVEALEVRR